jgi:hypothetical protein
VSGQLLFLPTNADEAAMSSGGSSNCGALLLPVASLGGLPTECLDLIVLLLAGQHPPLALARLAVTSRRMRRLCVARADGVWQSMLRQAFGPWISAPDPTTAPGEAHNVRAHAHYSARMGCRVGMRRCVRALRTPDGRRGGGGVGVLGRSLNRGLDDAAIGALHSAAVAAAGVRPSLPSPPSPSSSAFPSPSSSAQREVRGAAVGCWELPCELIEWYRAADGEPRYAGGQGSVDPRGAALVVRGFRLLSWAEVVEEVTEDGWSVQVSEPDMLSVPAPCPGVRGQTAASAVTTLSVTHSLGVQRLLIVGGG